MGEAFWRFSLVLYSRPGVAEALLRLQDRDGCDANLILFALWCGAVLRRRLDLSDVATAEAASSRLRDTTVVPLRDLRRRLKPAAEPDARDLRRRVMALELAAERRVQSRLAASVGGPGDEAADPIAAAEANLALYLGPARAACAEAAALHAALAVMVLR
jgi:uncharacterized protein (TIGR02444 family)